MYTYIKNLYGYIKDIYWKFEQFFLLEKKYLEYKCWGKTARLCKLISCRLKGVIFVATDGRRCPSWKPYYPAGFIIFIFGTFSLWKRTMNAWLIYRPAGSGRRFFPSFSPFFFHYSNAVFQLKRSLQTGISLRRNVHASREYGKIEWKNRQTVIIVAGENLNVSQRRVSRLDFSLLTHSRLLSSNVSAYESALLNTSAEEDLRPNLLPLRHKVNVILEFLNFFLEAWKILVP